MTSPLLLLAPLLLTAQDSKPAPDPAAVRGRHLAELTVQYVPYVFADKPEAAISGDASLRKELGEVAWKARHYSATHEAADPADGKPGPYAAHVTIRPAKGPHQTRFITLFKLPGEVPADRRFRDDEHDALAKAVGVKAEAVERNAELVKRILKGRSFGEWSKDPQAARLLAGLYLSKPGKGSANKWDDAFAVERQWWVELKRKHIYKDEKYDGKPFVCPTPIEGDPAPAVRAGTEKEAGVKQGTAKKIDEALLAFEKDTDEAFAVCVVRDGVIVLHKAYGKRDGKPMTVDTPSWMASVTKTMSAALMLMLIDQGKVKLDDPVDKYLPALRGIKVKKPLTTHHLYTHTNGLTLDGYPGWSDEMPDVAERVAAYYGRLKVGTEWAYTGTGNILGGKVFEMVTGEAVPQAIHKHLLAPLGCTNTHVTDTHAGAYSVPLDMAKFGQLLLNRGAYGKWRFFDEKTFEVMLPGKLDKLLGEGARRTFGFGLDGSRDRFGHGAASAATFHVDVKRKLVVIMTRNRQGKNQDKYNGAFWKAIDDGVPVK